MDGGGWRGFSPIKQVPAGFTQWPEHLFKEDPERKEAWLGDDSEVGFFHVTTNLPAVLKEGALRSRAHLRSRGVPAIGLGGGHGDLGADRISVVLTLDDALRIERGMRLMVDVLAGIAAPDDAMVFLEDDNAASLQDVEDELASRLDAYGRRDATDGWAAVAEDEMPSARLRVLGAERGADLYEAVRAWETMLSELLADMPGTGDWVMPPRNPIGFCVNAAQFMDVRPENICILRLAVKVGSDEEIYPCEREVRFRPECLEILGAMEPHPREVLDNGEHSVADVVGA